MGPGTGPSLPGRLLSAGSGAVFGDQGGDTTVTETTSRREKPGLASSGRKSEAGHRGFMRQARSSCHRLPFYTTVRRAKFRLQSPAGDPFHQHVHEKKQAKSCDRSNAR